MSPAVLPLPLPSALSRSPYPYRWCPWSDRNPLPLHCLTPIISLLRYITVRAMRGSRDSQLLARGPRGARAELPPSPFATRDTTTR